MARQKELTGIERESIEEINVAAESYVKARNKRMRLTEQEVASKTALIEAMTKHKKRVYRDDEASPPLIITLTEAKTSVKVATAEAYDGGEAEGDEGDE